MSRRRRHARQRDRRRHCSALRRLLLNRRAQVNNLFLQSACRSQHPVVESEARISKAEQSLL
jgi:hypothetical protein